MLNLGRNHLNHHLQRQRWQNISVTTGSTRLPVDWKETEIRLVGTHPIFGSLLSAFPTRIACMRWNAALPLARFLVSNQHLYVDRNVLELGAGGDFPSIVTVKNEARKVSHRMIHSDRSFNIVSVSHIVDSYGLTRRIWLTMLM